MNVAEAKGLEQVMRELHSFIRNHPELELCDHNSKMFIAELKELDRIPTLADFERVYIKLGAARKLILIGEYGQ